MSEFPRRSPATAGQALALALLLSPAGLAVAQAPPPARVQAVPPANDPVVASFEGGTITRSEVLDFLSQYTIAPDRRAEAYEQAVNVLINQKLLARFLEREKVVVTAADLDARVAAIAQELQQSGQGSLNSMLAELGMTETELREQLMMDQRWSKYVATKGDEATLRAYFEKNKDLFTGTAVKASHILAAVDPEATDEQKEAARQKLVELKRKITAGELDFAVAADQFSEDPSNQEAPDGGNIGYFNRRGQVVEPFAEAAFALEVDEVSDPVETQYGYHLIKVTDRRDGQEVAFDQIKDAVRAAFGEDLQQQIIEKARAEANIEIKPMPDDFFPVAPATLPGSLPSPAASPR
ncbi:peptidylprolyl isomerase [Tautonia sociabilis]|uniref:PpiC domain-containing protein n=1 Tax=Tautonia sociabilis TaxID=2080755 RepID=A0A432MNF6_9BACT|nr:peptidylprolyl isomerase [Tautonia sociabilis]RUL88779.1 hypothetical protein TsocGM_05330 [Tautonia sociabilis]